MGRIQLPSITMTVPLNSTIKETFAGSNITRTLSVQGLGPRSISCTALSSIDPPSRGRKHPSADCYTHRPTCNGANNSILYLCFYFYAIHWLLYLSLSINECPQSLDTSLPFQCYNCGNWLSLAVDKRWLSEEVRCLCTLATLLTELWPVSHYKSSTNLLVALPAAHPRSSEL